MIEVIGGNLFQWDTGRVAQVNTDADIHEVHFTTKDMTYAYVVSTYEKDGAVYCEIPNIILQQKKSLICYEVTNTDNGEMTVAETTLDLHKRNKPQDYVYTEDELKNFDRLAALIPTKLSQLTDDIGAGGAKITSVNGVLPDENGNVEVQAGINSADVARIVKDEFAGGVGYVAGEEIVVVYPEKNLSFVYQDDMLVATIVNVNLEIGETYTITWDGIVYTCLCSSVSGGYPAVGDLGMWGGTPNGTCPFIIVDKTDSTIAAIGVDNEYNHILSITKETVNYEKIDEKYFPVITSMIMKSSTEGSTKQFKITVDDSGTITAAEVS